MQLNRLKVWTLVFTRVTAKKGPKRWEMIERLQHLGPSTIRGLARSLERDVKRVHDDVTAMIGWGLVEKREDGRVHVPYQVIHAAFDLKAVA